MEFYKIYRCKIHRTTIVKGRKEEVKSILLQGSYTLGEVVCYRVKVETGDLKARSVNPKVTIKY